MTDRVEAIESALVRTHIFHSGSQVSTGPDIMD